MARKKRTKMTGLTKRCNMTVPAWQKNQPGLTRAARKKGSLCRTGTGNCVTARDKSTD